MADQFSPAALASQVLFIIVLPKELLLLCKICLDISGPEVCSMDFGRVSSQ